MADLPNRLQVRICGSIDRRIKEKLVEVTADYDDSVEAIDLMARWNWNKASHRVQFTDSTKEGADASDLGDFALTPTMLLLFCKLPLPHVALNFAPDDTHRFPCVRPHP